MFVMLASGVGCRAADSTSSRSATYIAALSGAREVPASGTTASGSATLTVTGSTLVYSVSTSGFATPLSVGHIHVGGGGQIGPVIVPFTIVAQTGMVATGSVDLSKPVSYNTLTLSGDSLVTLMDAGLMYVNLHTAAFPGGEIRGQIVRQ